MNAEIVPALSVHTGQPAPLLHSTDSSGASAISVSQGRRPYDGKHAESTHVVDAGSFALWHELCLGKVCHGCHLACHIYLAGVQGTAFCRGASALKNGKCGNAGSLLCLLCMLHSGQVLSGPFSCGYSYFALY